LSFLSKASDELVAAVTASPAAAVLAGMNEQEVEAVRSAWRRRAHPAEFDREKRLTNAIGHIDNAGKALEGTLRRMLTPEQAWDIAKAEKAQAKVDAITAKAKAAAKAAGEAS
jgi:hypothetical protein